MCAGQHCIWAENKTARLLGALPGGMQHTKLGRNKYSMLLYAFF